MVGPAFHIDSVKRVHYSKGPLYNPLLAKSYTSVEHDKITLNCVGSAGFFGVHTRF